MARGVNKVIIVGNAGNDAEVRQMTSGATVASVSLATTESWKDKQTGQMQERTEWHRVSFMDRGNFKLGGIAGNFIKKGSKVYVEGSLRTREWEKDGIKRYTTEVIANEMQLLDGLPDSQGQQNQQQQPNQAQQRPRTNQNQQAPQGFNQPQQGGYGQQNGYTQARNQPQQNQAPQQGPNFDDFDDDIPFNQGA